MANKNSGAQLRVADGTGGLRGVEDHRFDETPWPIELRVEAEDAQAWMAHVTAEAETRGWSSASLGQLDAAQNSGSLTLHLTPGPAGPTIDVAWEKRRDAHLEARLRPGGDPAPDLDLVHGFVRAVEARVRERRVDTKHRRGVLLYQGLPWKGELWLTDTLRLGPPSRFAPALHSTQAVVVDAQMSGIGWQGVHGNFYRLLREMRLVLSPILGVHLGTESSSGQSWVPEFDDQHKLIDCRIRATGYWEGWLPDGFPSPGAAPPIDRLPMREELARLGIPATQQTIRVPEEVESLWRAFGALPDRLKHQFLNACNAFSIANDLWPDQRTACAAFLVVTCEALKPTGRRYRKANVYDVIASLGGEAIATELRGQAVSPQQTRSEHFHRGVLVADDLPNMLFGDPFSDPSFDTMLRDLWRVTRVCLVLWLSRGGRYQFVWLPREPRGQRWRSTAKRWWRTVLRWVSRQLRVR